MFIFISKNGSSVYYFSAAQRDEDIKRIQRNIYD